MDRTIIGFCGGKWGCSGVGKTTAARFLVDKGFRLVSFSDPIERVAKAQAGWNGVRDAAGKRILDAVCRGGRKVSEDYWTHLVMKSIPSEEKKIVFDDIWFANERRFIKSSGGWVIEIIRPLVPASDLDFEVDASVFNKGGFDDFRESILSAVYGLFPSL